MMNKSFKSTNHALHPIFLWKSENMYLKNIPIKNKSKKKAK